MWGSFIFCCTPENEHLHALYCQILIFQTAFFSSIRHLVKSSAAIHIFHFQKKATLTLRVIRQEDKLQMLAWWSLETMMNYFDRSADLRLYRPPIMSFVMISS